MVFSSVPGMAQKGVSSVPAPALRFPLQFFGSLQLSKLNDSLNGTGPLHETCGVLDLPLSAVALLVCSATREAIP